MKKLRSLLVCVCLFAFSFAFAEDAPEQKQIRVYADMVGDLFHAGHVEFFKKARAFGNYLIVGVHANDVVEGYKRNPILTLEERVAVISACRYVDEVVIAAPLNPSAEFLKEHQIDYVVHGDDFNPELVHAQYEEAIKLGIFRSVPYTPGISSTQIIKRIVDRYNQGEFRK